MTRVGGKGMKWRGNNWFYGGEGRERIGLLFFWTNFLFILDLLLSTR